MFVKSKSGSTSEPRNAMKEVEHDFYKKESNSVLWKYANTNDWICCLPIIIGLVAIQADCYRLPYKGQISFIEGAKYMDDKTRKKLDKNPDIGLDLVYDGSKDIVVLPYKGRLSTFPRYSLWNILAKNTNVVNQGFTWH